MKLIGLLVLFPVLAPAQESKEAKEIVKDRSSFLRTALKTYATFVGADRAKGEVLLRAESDGGEKAVAIDADAEVRVSGYWGGIEDLVKGDRVWLWTRVDREGKPRAIFMIADEISEQDIHRVPYALSSVDLEKREVVVHRKLDGKAEQSRALRISGGLAVASEEGDFLFRPKEAAAALRVKPGGAVYVRTSGTELLAIADAEGVSSMKEAQKERLEGRWKRDGLPGTLGAMHALVGEVEVILDHEGMKWARALQANDVVKVRGEEEKSFSAAVLEVRPWNERTRVTLALSGRDLADVRTGQRVRLRVPEPGAEVLKSRLPPDAGRPRAGAARIEWFLESTYCSCSISGDV